MSAFYASIGSGLLLLSSLFAYGGDIEKPLFSFGLVADIQYADKPDAGSRHYRSALGKAAKCVEAWNAQELAFAVELGDISDDRRDKTAEDIKAVLAALQPLKPKLYHVLGNHGMKSLGEMRCRQLLETPSSEAWYDFTQGSWRFIVLNGVEWNVLDENGRNYSEARMYFEAHKGKDHPELVIYNGALGPVQRAWLKERLDTASKNGEKAVVFCHMPVFEGAAGGRGHILWDYKEVLEILDASSSFSAWFAGHHHLGGYAMRNGAHHVTLQAILDAPAEGNAYAIIDVFQDRLRMNGFGTVPNRSLTLR